MRRFLAAATLLLPVVAASGTVMAPFHVDFAAPAQAQGNLAMDRAEWALVLFHNSQHGDFNLSLAAGAKQTNFTMWKADVHSPQQGHFGAPVLEPDKVSTFPDAVAAQLDFYGSQWSSLVVQADSISAALAPSDANLQTTEDGQFIPSPPVHFPEDSLTEFNVKGALWHVPEGVAVSATPMNASASVLAHLHIQGVHRIGWHNATVFCASASCPEPGRTWAVPLDNSEVRRYSYIEVETLDGTLDGIGMVIGMTTGARSLGLHAQGTLRLPDAILTGSCPGGSCPAPAGQTFSAQGNLSFEALGKRPDRSSRLQAQLGGQFTSAFFDESPAPGFGGVAAAAAAAVVAVGIGFGLRYLWTAFARSARPPVLEDASRKKIHDTIREHPGFSFSELRRHLGWSTGRLEYHLGFLVEAGLVVRHRDRKAVRFFENHGKYDDTWRHVAPLREDDARRLHDWLLKTPGLDQTRIAETTAAWGWTRARTLRRLARLEEGGLLSAKRDGKRLRYTAIRAPV